MQLCSDDHDEVCYEARFCPCCAKVSELKDSDDGLSTALAKIEELENKVANLAAQLREAGA